MEHVDAQVAVKRSNNKAGTDMQTNCQPARPAAASILTSDRTEVSGLPGPASGVKLRAAVNLFESQLLGVPVGQRLFESYRKWVPGLQDLEAMLEEAYPEEPRPTAHHGDSWGSCALVQEEVCAAADAHSRLDAALHSVHRGGLLAGSTKCSTASNIRPTVLDFHFAYTHDMITPSAVAERVIKFLEAHNAKNHWLSAWSAQHIREAAAAATERFAAGKPLSVLDGVPFVVKDCIDALPYETSFGTRFMGQLHPAKADAPCVAALKELGAVLLGKGSMVELGIFAHGQNPHAGAIRNPHHPSRTAGGSSSGAAAAVAVGLCPIAIGTDGGGSIRVPASYCGVTGLKPTAGRLADDHGAHSGCYSSLVVTGPIANSAADLALLYAVMANVDYANGDARKPGAAAARLPGVAEAAAAAAAAPPRPLGLPRVLVELPQDAASSLDQVALTELKPLKGLRVGVFNKWCYNCSPAVAEAMRTTLNKLLALGAQQVEVTLPELDLCQVGHLATWTKEIEADAEARGWLQEWSLRGQLNLDSRLFLVAASTFSPRYYEQAQRMRARVLSHFRRALESCDVIMTPATPTTAPVLAPEANTTGVYNPAATYESVRFTLAANFTGLPAIVLPAGRQMGSALPIGVQFMAGPYAEATLLRTAAALEAQQLEDGMPRPVPSVMINPIQGEKGSHPLAEQMTRKLWATKYGKPSGPTL